MNSRLSNSIAARVAFLSGCGLVALLLGGCRHKQTVADLPPLPPLPAANAAQHAPARPAAGAEAGREGGYSPSKIPVTPVPRGGISREDVQFVQSHDPIYTEEGVATWYTAPYKGRKAANGQVFSDDAMTAAVMAVA